MGRLDHKTALVTGGASGLGKAIAQRLAVDGARVVVTDRQSDVGSATASAGGFLFFEQDVSREESWPIVMEQIELRCGQLDVLVNNAGILGPSDALDPENTRLEDWRKIFAVNVEGVFLGCRAAIKMMRKSGNGSIINISSIAGLLATPYATAYGASKAAVRQLTKSVAQHCAQERLNIRCNSIHPGLVKTALSNNYAQEDAQRRGMAVDEVIEEQLRAVPLGEFTLPEDVAAMVSFLASDEARHMTGAQLVVDGGVVNCDTYRQSTVTPPRSSVSATTGRGAYG